MDPAPPRPSVASALLTTGDGRDPLTGALTRTRLLARLDVALRAGPAAVCVVGLDHFRLLNDAHGHAAGDEMLAAAAGAIAECLRPVDVIGRVGSDEFAVVLGGAGLEAATALAEEALAAVRSVPTPAGIRMTASIGAAAGESCTAADLVAQAGQAMVAAKEAGRDRLAVAAREDRDRAVETMRWATAIRDALEFGGLEAWAQPIVPLRGDALPRYELLVRLGGVSPTVFLPVAERFGQMQAIDGWMVGRALDLLAREDRIVLHVNLSPSSMGDAQFTRFLERAVIASGVDPARIVFELTETAALAEMPDVDAAAARLRALGSGLALDDFGTGFASFAHLRRLPFDVVKIAGDFVQGLHRSRLDRLTVEAMLHVARGMGMLTVAEYVEDTPTMHVLRDLGVDYVQGVHVDPPSPVAERWPR